MCKTRPMFLQERFASFTAKTFARSVPTGTLRTSQQSVGSFFGESTSPRGCSAGLRTGLEKCSCGNGLPPCRDPLAWMERAECSCRNVSSVLHRVSGCELKKCSCRNTSSSQDRVHDSVMTVKPTKIKRTTHGPQWRSPFPGGAKDR